MNDIDRKYLVEQIGECWHEKGEMWKSKFNPFTKTETFFCYKCGKYGIDIRTFDNWNDFGAVWEWFTKHEKWFDFLIFVWNSPEKGCKGPVPNYPPGLYDHHFIAWLIDKDRFPALVVEFLRDWE